jgi:hypothetical protein
MHELDKLLRERICSGLQRQAVTRCSKWAERYRVMGQPFPGPWRFDHHPWCKEIHDCESELIVGMKAAQMAYTETALNKTFFKMDVHGVSCLYVLPVKNPDASDFSNARFDPALELSPHLTSMFVDTKNVGHKRSGAANLYIRGSRSRAQLKSIPVGYITFDEVDEMEQKNIPLAFERMSGQLAKQAFMLSTPTVNNEGIDVYWQQTTQEEYFFKCPHCGRLTMLTWPDCVVITAEEKEDPALRNTYLICKECKHKLDHDAKIEWLALDNCQWVPSSTDRLNRGFHISQLYSMVRQPWEVAFSYLSGLTNPADEQEFHNSKLGATHEVEGARVLDTDITECQGQYQMPHSYTGTKLVTMGVDVGNWLHYEIDEWTLRRGNVSDINQLATPRLLRTGKVKEFDQILKLMAHFKVSACVVDANPERRAATTFARMVPGRVRLCIYGRGVSGRLINANENEDHMITVDRTSWLDVSLPRFRNHKILLPIDLPLEYREQVQAPARIYEKDKDGNAVARYVTGNKDDHHAHARNYAEIALPVAMSLATTQPIGKFL